METQKMEKWGTKLTIKFLKKYREHRCLWDFNDPEYKNRVARTKALEDIVACMALNNFDIRSANVKIKALRSTYLHEKRKIRKLTKTGTVYRPKLAWYPLADSFLRNYVMEKFCLMGTIPKEEGVPKEETLEGNTTQLTITENQQESVNVLPAQPLQKIGGKTTRFTSSQKLKQEKQQNVPQIFTMQSQSSIPSSSSSVQSFQSNFAANQTASQQQIQQQQYQYQQQQQQIQQQMQQQQMQQQQMQQQQMQHQQMQQQQMQQQQMQQNSLGQIKPMLSKVKKEKFLTPNQIQVILSNTGGEVVESSSSFNNFNNLNNNSQIQQQITSNDEFEAFASSIAAQMRNLPLDVAYEVQLQIQCLITQAKLKTLGRQTSNFVLNNSRNNNWNQYNNNNINNNNNNFNEVKIEQDDSNQQQQQQQQSHHNNASHSHEQENRNIQLNNNLPNTICYNMPTQSSDDNDLQNQDEDNTSEVEDYLGLS